MSNLTTWPCRDFPLQIWLLLSDELPAAEQSFWQAHLQSCARCREVLAEAQSAQEQYAGLPLYEAPAQVVHKIIRRARPPRRLAWWEAFARRSASFFDFRPRLAVAAVALAVLMWGFHYLAFQTPIQPAWEAAAFDAQAKALASALMEYEAFESGGLRHPGQTALFSWEAQATDLRASITALKSELQNSKL